MSQGDVDQARRDDLAEYQSFVADFNQLLGEMTSLDSRVETDVIFGLRARVDQLYDQWISFGGGDSEYKNALLRIHTSLVWGIKKSVGNVVATQIELAQ